jgi:calcineurin-like phosphoesterase family protein
MFVGNKIFFTSDHHFNHNNVIAYCGRPFSSVEEMNEHLVYKWNSIVGENDTVYHLGDFSFSITAVEQYLHRLNGRKVLIPGNHDWCHPSNKKSNTLEKGRLISELYLSHGWDEVKLTDTIKVAGTSFNLSHFPYDTEDTRFTKYLLKDKNTPLLCGHVHQHWKTKGNMINVGVDVWDYAPVSSEQIMELLNV